MKTWIRKTVLCLLSMLLFLAPCASASDATNDELQQEVQELRAEVARLERLLADNGISSDPTQDSDTQTSYTQEEINNIIRVVSIETTEPNSAGGVDVEFAFENHSDKEIKYLRFTVSPYNGVGDQVSSDIGDTSRLRASITGPVPSPEAYTSVFENAWYNSTIEYAKLEKIEIEYMDGEMLEIDAPDVDKVFWDDSMRLLDTDFWGFEWGATLDEITAREGAEDMSTIRGKEAHVYLRSLFGCTAIASLSPDEEDGYHEFSVEILDFSTNPIGMEGIKQRLEVVFGSYYSSEESTRYWASDNRLIVCTQTDFSEDSTGIIIQLIDANTLEEDSIERQKYEEALAAQ